MNEQHGNQHHAHHEHAFKHRRPFLKDLERLGDEYLIRKSPAQIPHKWKDVIVKLLPILVLIAAILTLPGIFGSFLVVIGIAGHSAASRGLYGVYRGAAYPIILINFLAAIAIAVLYFKAFDPLRKRQYVGWAYVFYAGLIGFAANLLDGGIIGAIIWFAITMYLLFQVKELYH